MPSLTSSLYIEVRYGAGVVLDEVAPRLDLVAHEHGEDAICDGGILERHLSERACRRGHRGFTELVGVHLAEALEALQPHALLRNPHDRIAECLKRGRRLVRISEAHVEGGRAG